jgi:hypothetical protein
MFPSVDFLHHVGTGKRHFDNLRDERRTCMVRLHESLIALDGSLRVLDERYLPVDSEPDSESSWVAGPAAEHEHNYNRRL